MAEIETLRELRRSQIVAAARKLVSEGGLQALTIQALEERLAFTRGVITYHFRNKDEIVAAVFESALREIDEATAAAVRAEMTMEDKVRAVYRSVVFGFLDRVEAVRILISFWGQIQSEPEVACQNARVWATYRRRFASLVRQGQESGAFEDHPPQEMAALAIATTMGIALQVYFDRGSIDPERVTEEASRTMLSRLASAPAAEKRDRRRVRRHDRNAR